MSHRRKTGDRRKLVRTYRQTQGTGLSGVAFNAEKKRYIRYWPGSRAKFLRHVGNKRVRKAKGIYRRGQYRKVFDYMWILD